MFLYHQSSKKKSKARTKTKKKSKKSKTRMKKKSINDGTKDDDYLKQLIDASIMCDSETIKKLIMNPISISIKRDSFGQNYLIYAINSNHQSSNCLKQIINNETDQEILKEAISHSLNLKLDIAFELLLNKLDIKNKAEVISYYLENNKYSNKTTFFNIIRRCISNIINPFFEYNQYYSINNEMSLLQKIIKNEDDVLLSEEEKEYKDNLLSLTEDDIQLLDLKKKLYLELLSSEIFLKISKVEEIEEMEEMEEQIEKKRKLKKEKDIHLEKIKHLNNKISNIIDVHELINKMIEEKTKK